MGWQARHKGLSVEEAKEQLLAISEQGSGPLGFVTDHPFRAMLVALAAGLVFSKSLGLLGWAGKTGLSIVSQFLLPQVGPQSPTLDRLRARTYRRGLRR